MNAATPLKPVGQNGSASSSWKRALEPISLDHLGSREPPPISQ